MRVRGFSNRSERVCFGPKRPGGADSVDSGFAPPRGFVTRSMHLAMMAAAQRDDEFVADLAPERAMLRKPKVMGIRRLTPTNQTGLLGYEFAVGLVPKPTRFRQREQALVDAIENGLFAWLCRTRFLRQASLARFRR